MDFTFGICVTKENKHLHPIIYNQIKNQKIPNKQIIFIGDIYHNLNKDWLCENLYDDYIHFDETQKTGWITKKKNLIVENAKYENIVLMHDYIVLENGWYEGFLKFGNDFQVCMNRVHNLDGKRNIDWLVYYQDYQLPNAEQLLPYDQEFSKIMYIPGFYWVAKKNVMQEFPLNENLIWGEAEDVEWSKRVRSKYKFTMNSHSAVKFLKQKEYVLNEMSKESLNSVKNFYNNYFGEQ